MGSFGRNGCGARVAMSHRAPAPVFDPYDSRGRMIRRLAGMGASATPGGEPSSACGAGNAGKAAPAAAFALDIIIWFAADWAV